MSIAAKLVEARQYMSFEKTHSQKLGYKILNADEVLEMVGNALAKVDVLFIPSIVDADVTYHEAKSGKLFQHALATIDMKFICAETGEVIDATTHGSATDYGDKALGKAQTYGIKYFFSRMFLKGKDDFNDEERMIDEPAPRSKSAPPSELDEHLGPRNPRNEGPPQDDDLHWWHVKEDRQKLYTWGRRDKARLAELYGIANGADLPSNDPAWANVMTHFPTVQEALQDAAALESDGA